jgi:hypothetical protein
MRTIADKTGFIGFRVTPTVKKALEKAAVRDSRTLSSLLEKMVTDWLHANDRLKP